MNAHPLAATILCLALGMVLQACLMLRARFRSGDAGTVALLVGISLFALLPFQRDLTYRPVQHWFAVCLTAAVLFAGFFRARLLPRIGGRVLLAWNILFVFVALRAGVTSPILLVPLAIVSTLTVVNAFSDIDRGFGWKVFFHAWFTIMLVVLALRGMDSGPLGELFAGDPAVTQRSLVEMALTGAFTLYLVTNAFFVVALIPIKGRRQSWKDRMEEIRRHAELLASGYVWEKDDPVRSLAVLIVLPLLLFATARWGVGDERVIVSVAIALMPALTGQVPEAPEDSPARGPRRAGSRRQKRRAA